MYPSVVLNPFATSPTLKSFVDTSKLSVTTSLFPSAITLFASFCALTEVKYKREPSSISEVVNKLIASVAMVVAIVVAVLSA